MLTLVGEELLDVPLYYSVHELAKTCRTIAPAADVIRSAIVNAGALSSFAYSFAVARDSTGCSIRQICFHSLVHPFPALLRRGTAARFAFAPLFMQVCFINAFSDSTI